MVHRHSTRLLCTVVLILTAMATGSSVAPARAAVVDGAIEEVSIVQDSVGYYESVTVTLDWCVPDTVRAGDSFSLELPAGLRALTPGFDLETDGGEVIARASYAAGNLTFTLTDVVERLRDVCGSAFFDASTVESQINGGQLNQFDFAAGGSTFSDTVRISAPPAENHEPALKRGLWTDQNVDDISWLVDLPLGPYDRAFLSDSAGNGQAIDCSSVRVRLTTTFDTFGRPTNLAPTDRYNSTCSASGLTVSVSFAGTGELFRVEYHTTVTDATQTSYPNDAAITITSGGCPQKRTADKAPVAKAPCGRSHAEASVPRPEAGGEGDGTSGTAIEIQKFSAAEGAVAGDFDLGPGKPLAAGAPEPLQMTVTNTGSSPLVDLVITDETSDGPAATGLTCDFTPVGGPAAGTSWTGPLRHGGTFTCTATVPGLGPAQSHADTATVSAVDAVTQTRVSSSDAWNGHVPTHPAIDIEKWTTSEGPGPGDHDTRENAGVLGAGVATPLTFTISNPGDVRLFDVEVTDATHRGPAAQHLSCDFSPLGGPATGTTWAGPLLAGASFVCHATVPGLPDGGIHVDTAYVVAADDIEGEGTDVSDADAWSAAVPADHDPGDPDPGDPDPGDDGVADPDSGGGGALPDTGGVDAAVLVLGLLATIGGASMIGWRRLRS